MSWISEGRCSLTYFPYFASMLSIFIYYISSKQLEFHIWGTSLRKLKETFMERVSQQSWWLRSTWKHLATTQRGRLYTEACFWILTHYFPWTVVLLQWCLTLAHPCQVSNMLLETHDNMHTDPSTILHTSRKEEKTASNWILIEKYHILVFFP